MLATSFERFIRQGDPSPTPTSLSQTRSFLNTDDTFSRKNSNKNLHSKVANFVGPHFFNNTNFLHSFTKTFETVISYQQSLTHIVLDITKLLEKIQSSSPNNLNTTPKTHHKRLSYTENQPTTPSNNQLKGEINALATSLKKLLEQIPSIQKEGSYNLDKSSAVSQSKIQSPKSVSQVTTPKKRPTSSSSTTNLAAKQNRSVTSHKKMESAKKSRVQLNRENSQDHSTNSTNTRFTATSVKGRDQYKRFPFFVNNSNSKENSNHRSAGGLQKKHSRNYTLQEILNKQDLVINLLEDKTEFEAESRLLQTLQSDFEENKEKVQIKETKNTRKSLLMVPKKEVEEEEGESPSQTTLSMENYSSVKQILGDFDFPTNAIPTEERLQERSIIKEMIRKEEEFKDSRPYSDFLERLPLKKYLIDAKWWRAWKEHANFDGKEASDYGRSSPLYQRPGPITNIRLLKPDSLEQEGDNGIKLKENLLEHHDFEAFSEEIFKTLAEWYGCDFEIPKMLRLDPSQPYQVFLDIYPNKFAKRLRSLRK